MAEPVYRKTLQHNAVSKAAREPLVVDRTELGEVILEQPIQRRRPGAARRVDSDSSRRIRWLRAACCAWRRSQVTVFWHRAADGLEAPLEPIRSKACRI